MVPIICNNPLLLCVGVPGTVYLSIDVCIYIDTNEVDLFHKILKIKDIQVSFLRNDETILHNDQDWSPIETN